MAQRADKERRDRAGRNRVHQSVSRGEGVNMGKIETLAKRELFAVMAIVKTDEQQKETKWTN